jgi:hypothetical protein
MESDSYSPLLNISVIPQVTYRLVRGKMAEIVVTLLMSPSLRKIMSE